MALSRLVYDPPRPKVFQRARGAHGPAGSGAGAETRLQSDAGHVGLATEPPAVDHANPGIGPPERQSRSAGLPAAEHGLDLPGIQLRDGAVSQSLDRGQRRIVGRQMQETRKSLARPGLGYGKADGIVEISRVTGTGPVAPDAPSIDNSHQDRTVESSTKLEAARGLAGDSPLNLEPHKFGFIRRRLLECLFRPVGDVTKLEWQKAGEEGDRLPPFQVTAWLGSGDPTGSCRFERSRFHSSLAHSTPSSRGLARRTGSRSFTIGLLLGNSTRM